VGPKELPLLMRKAGAMMTKVRAMASDFRATFDEMARQSELDELRKEVESLREKNPLSEFQDDIAKAIDFDMITDEDKRLSHSGEPVPESAATDAPAKAAKTKAKASPKPKAPRKPRSSKTAETTAAIANDGSQ
jgi:sec-independent protein translocase protein TatB